MIVANSNVTYTKCYSDIEKESFIITSKELKSLELFQPDLNYSNEAYDVKKASTRYTFDNIWTMIGSVEDSYFHDISVSESGAAIRIATSNFTLTVDKVFFSQCTSYSGYDAVTAGAIYYVVYTGYIFVYKTCGINCSSMQEAHFSYCRIVDNGSASISDLTIAQCPSSIKYQGYTQGFFMNSRFERTNISNCQCTSFAAGMYSASIDFPSDQKSIQFNYSSFSHLSCKKYGLFNTEGSSCLLDSCNLIENTGLLNIMPMFNGNSTLLNCYFKGNVNLTLPLAEKSQSEPNSIKFGKYCKVINSNTALKIALGISIPIIIIGVAILVYCVINNKMLAKLQAKEDLRREVDLSFG